MTITCSRISIDSEKNIANLWDASVINGAQTRGEILHYLNGLISADNESTSEIEAIEAPFNVRAEIIVDPDNASVIETAIARNTASPVKSISQAGGRGQLDELDDVIFRAFKRRIKRSETDDDGLDTFHVLQATRLLMPTEITQSDSTSEILRPYKQRGNCLDDFTRWYENRSTDEGDKGRYDFTLQMAPTAIREFEYWQKGSMFNGKSIRAETGGQKKRSSKRKIKGGEIIWVSPGIVFPILSALREFVELTNEKWQLSNRKYLKKLNSWMPLLNSGGVWILIPCRWAGAPVPTQR